MALEREDLAVAAPAGVAGGVGPAAARPVAPRGDPGYAPMASTSMQLAMESKPVVDATGGYLRDLAKIVDGQSDVVGYAYAINGKLNSAEVYASRELFLKMWPKLVRASAVEALTGRPKAQASQKAPGIPAVQAVLSDAEKASETSRQVSGPLTVVKRESAQTLLFETRDRGPENAWMHRSYVVK